MRLILAAIFCSALLSGLLNMKRFALQEDTGRGNLRGSHQQPAPPLPNPGEEGRQHFFFFSNSST
jgi:hypothetical protein